MQITGCACQKPVDDGTKMAVDFEAVVEDFKLIGRGLVRDVVVRGNC